MGKKVQNQAALGQVKILQKVLKFNLGVARLKLEKLIESVESSNYSPGSSADESSKVVLNNAESEVDLLKSLLSSVKDQEYDVLFVYYTNLKLETRNLKYIWAADFQHPINEIIEALRVLSEDAK